MWKITFHIIFFMCNDIMGYTISLCLNYVLFYNNFTMEHLLFMSFGENDSIPILPLQDF